ncbi:MAG: putative membrane protein [Ulvibacter sp.]|jgi:uncharacterized membrane protein
MIEKSINSEDIIQVVIGASALTVPVAFSEESWRLSETLPLFNVIFILFLSLLFIGLYSVQGIFQGHIKHRYYILIARTIVDYAVTLIVVFIILFALNRMPIFDDPIVAIKRVILLSFPASIGGVIVDGFDKE